MGATRGGAARGAVVFDLDGTLVDSVGVIAAVLNGMRAERDLPPLALERVRPFVTFGGAALIEALLDGAWGETPQALREFRSRYAATSTPLESVYPGAPGALSGLREAGFGLAVFSNKPQGLCEKVLADVGLAGFFGAIVGTSPTIPLKPDPKGYLRAVELCGGTPERSCLVGDSDADAQLALRAKVPLIFAAWGYGDTASAGPGVLVADGLDQAADLALKCLSALAPA